VTMSLHKLSAGHGYDYLIRQVAALDATHRGRTDLASYYTERGETPGRWVGRGLAGVDGLDVGDVVTGEQMWLLFAEGRHPLAETLPGNDRLLAPIARAGPRPGTERARTRTARPLVPSLQTLQAADRPPRLLIVWPATQRSRALRVLRIRFAHP
jgi:TrwC relaxase